MLSTLPPAPENAADWADIIAVILAVSLFLYAEFRLLRERRQQNWQETIRQARQVSAWLETEETIYPPGVPRTGPRWYKVFLMIQNASETPIWEVRIDDGPEALLASLDDARGQGGSAGSEPFKSQLRMLGSRTTKRISMNVKVQGVALAHDLEGTPWHIRFEDNTRRLWSRQSSGGLITMQYRPPKPFSPRSIKVIMWLEPVWMRLLDWEGRRLDRGSARARRKSSGRQKHQE